MSLHQLEGLQSHVVSLKRLVPQLEVRSKASAFRSFCGLVKTAIVIPADGVNGLFAIMKLPFELPGRVKNCGERTRSSGERWCPELKCCCGDRWQQKELHSIHQIWSRLKTSDHLVVFACWKPSRHVFPHRCRGGWIALMIRMHQKPKRHSQLAARAGLF